MRVYVLTTHAIVNYEDCGIGSRVFAKRDDALKALKDYRDDEMPCVEDYGWIVSEDREDYFEAYNDGDWNDSHTLGIVEECELE